MGTVIFNSNTPNCSISYTCIYSWVPNKRRHPNYRRHGTFSKVHFFSFFHPKTIYELWYIQKTWMAPNVILNVKILIKSYFSPFFEQQERNWISFFIISFSIIKQNETNRVNNTSSCRQSSFTLDLFACREELCYNNISRRIKFGSNTFYW